MSEKAKELAKAIQDNLELIRLGAGHRARPMPELIDAAVAPLVEALEDCIGMLQSFTGSRYDEEGAVAAQISDAEQALAAWRK